MTQVSNQRTYQDLRKELAFDRVLARLSAVAPDVWLLKGGVALEFRSRESRATTDIDVSVRGGIETVTELLIAAESLSLDDYFAIRIGERNKPISEVDTYRFNVTVLFQNGRRFEELKLDVGLADPWLGEPQALTARPLLKFADIAPSAVRAIPLVQHLAEKFHAYTKTYGNRGSTRVKDLVDMALLVRAEPVDEFIFGRTLHAVFQSRGTHPVPRVFPPPPASWRPIYARLAAGLPIPSDSDAAHQYVASMFTNALTLAAGLPDKSS